MKSDHHSKSHRRRNAGKVNPVSLVLLSVVILGALYIFRSPLRCYWLGSAFAAEKLQSYESLFKWGEHGDLSEGELPYRTGKVLLVRPSTWQVYREGTLFSTQISPHLEGKKEKLVDPARIDDCWYMLDGSLRASSPADVSTVILCEYAPKTVGVYVPVEGPQVPVADAVQREASLKVFDVKRGVFLGEYVLKGTGPLERTTWWGPHHGGMPEIAEFVAKMPVR